jgi:hypothetical protein
MKLVLESGSSAFSRHAPKWYSSRITQSGHSRRVVPPERCQILLEILALGAGPRVEQLHRLGSVRQVAPLGGGFWQCGVKFMGITLHTLGPGEGRASA